MPSFCLLAGARGLGRGKSGLQRAGCQVTPGGCEPTASATENIPPESKSSILIHGKGEKVW